MRKDLNIFRAIMSRRKVTVEIQDGRRKVAEGIRNVFGSRLDSAYYFITHFS